MFTASLLICLMFLNVSMCDKTAGYYKYKYSLQRDLLREKESEFCQNGIVLSKDEKIVQNYLQHLKNEEFIAKQDRFPPSTPLERILSEIKSSHLYRVLKKFPKGGNLHLHLNHILSKKKMLNMIFNSSLIDNLCVKTQPGPDQWQLTFFKTPPAGWVKVASDPVLYSVDQLLKRLTLLNTLNDNAKANPTDSSLRWQLMNPLFLRSGWTLVDYANYSRMHIKALFAAAIEDNVQYIEARANGIQLFVEDDTSITGQRFIDNEDGDLWMTCLREEINDFKMNNPQFIGYRQIANEWRFNDKEQIGKTLNKAIRVFKKNRDIIGGFDISGHEDSGHSLLYYIDAFADMEANKQHIPLYLHAAESVWSDDLLTSDFSDEPISTISNIYLALILGTKRIAHGLGLIKHPYLMKVVKEKKIAISVCPVSHMILTGIPDLRQHPALTFLRYGIPVVLGADGPGSFGYNDFTVDWYEVFMGWGLNLADLKQLAINSLEYSTMSYEEKVVAFKKWDKAYDLFISQMKNESCQANLDIPEPEVYSLFPCEGSLTSTTKVHVYGRNFQSGICKNITCYFGDVASKGTYVYDTMITCHSPVNHGPAVTVPFAISFNSEVHVQNTNLSFAYVHTLQKTAKEVTSIFDL